MEIKMHTQQAVLYVDVTCYRCKRAVAMSNTLELDGRRYCFNCYNKEKGENVAGKAMELFKKQEILDKIEGEEK